MREADDNSSDSTAVTNYAVGYCRPPLHTRFKPGQSGNPSGRVKGSKNLKSLFHQTLLVLVALYTKASFGVAGIAVLALLLLVRQQRNWAAFAVATTAAVTLVL